MAKKKDVRELLIQKATEQFARKGYLETTTKELATAAGVNSALVYYYFKNKEDILYIIIERSSKKLYEMLRDIQSSDMDSIECLAELIKTYLIFTMEQSETTKIIDQSTDKLKGHQKAQCIRRQGDIYHIFINQIRKIRSEGRLKDVHPEVVNLITMGMMNWLPRWFKSEGLLKMDVIVDQMIEVLFHGSINGV